MAFKNGFGERLDELRFPSPRSPPVDAPYASHTPLSPPANMMSAFSRPSTDVRANLQRRFTTDAGKLSSWSFLNQQSTQSPESSDLLSSATHIHKSQLIEKKRQHIEYMREQKKRFEADMKLLDMQHERERQEIDQLARDLAHAGLSGPVSEPTTPPEYRDSAFPTSFARPSRFSTSSVTSSPGIFNIFSPSQVTSPPATSQIRNGATATSNQRFSVHSVPGSRRNSEEEEYFPESVTTYRPGPSIHRYSMPTTSLAAQLKSVTANYNSSAMEPFNAARLLFGDEKGAPKDEDRLPTPDINSYLKMTDPDDKFPTLSHNSGLLSANSDALDLANSRTPEPWNTHHNRYRSMPQGDLNMFRSENQLGNSIAPDATPTPRHAARHSVELNMFLGKQEPTTPTASSSARPVSLQSSYSTNDLPTMKANGFGPAITPPKTHAEQFHQHNASLGRIPAGATRSAKDSPERGDSNLVSGSGSQSGLQATATPFGPQLASVAGSSLGGQATSSSMSSFQGQFYPYSVQPYVNNGMSANGAPAQNFSAQVPYSGFGQNGMFQFPRAQAARPSTAAVTHRSGETEAQQVSRFANLPLEQYRGELYNLCKDQHGCRYLQRKLEERTPEHVQLIFAETYMHVVELMTDPFGNYLCQKLLEYSNDDQRTRLIHNAAPQLVPIALNQHGTRALQKMIEFVSTPQQIQMVIDALRGHVVDLVQDLNGNHVIQKCLNRLSAEDAQFIYDAVGAHCVIVGTHRHGCCVLQRCIDHASGEQRARLIAQITSNAFSLVQDPFGNYVVQYILDLSEPHFTEPLCQSFLGNIPALSKQKFSSNVIEKCLRTAEYPMRRRMIDEVLVPRELDAMLRDSYANYVVQTAMDFADTDSRNRIVDAIRPILPSIRQTPHGRRIAGKIAGVETPGRTSGNPSGQVTPNDMTSGQLPASMQVPPKPFVPAQPSFNGNGASPQQYGAQQPLVSSTSSFNVNPVTAGPSEVSSFSHATNHGLAQSQAYGNGFY